MDRRVAFATLFFGVFLLHVPSVRTLLRRTETLEAQSAGDLWRVSLSFFRDMQRMRLVADAISLNSASFALATWHTPKTQHK